MDDYYIMVYVFVYYVFGVIVFNLEDCGYMVIVGDLNVCKVIVVLYCGWCDIFGMWYDLYWVCGVMYDRWLR